VGNKENRMPQGPMVGDVYGSFGDIRVTPLSSNNISSNLD
jgi:hypothetical protein